MKKLIFIFSTLSLSSFSQEELDLKVLKLVNRYRVENHLKPLIWDTIMTKVSNHQVNYMSTTGHLSHSQLEEDSTNFNVVKKFEDKFINQGVNFKCTVFENCSVVFDSDKLSTDSIVYHVVNGWKNSVKHNEVLLDKRLVKVGISHKSGTIYNEELIDENGDLFTITINCIMEWFSLNGYGFK
jgi:uncharacterized protein YkwD